MHAGHNYTHTCHNYTGYNHTGQNYTGHNNTGHNYTGHYYTGHCYTGRNYIGHTLGQLHTKGRQLEVASPLKPRAGRQLCGIAVGRGSPTADPPTADHNRWLATAWQCWCHTASMLSSLMSEGRRERPRLARCEPVSIQGERPFAPCWCCGWKAAYAWNRRWGTTQGLVAFCSSAVAYGK